MQEQFFAQLAEVLSFASPKESTQRKGDHSSLAFGFPHGDMIFRAGSIRYPWLKRTLGTHPVRLTQKITPQLGSSEGGMVPDCGYGVRNGCRCSEA